MNSRQHSTCAFCNPQGVLSTFSLRLNSSSTRKKSCYTTRRYKSFFPVHGVRPALSSTRKRQRKTVNTPLTCTFGKNSNNSNEKFMSQAADVLLNAGRFFQSPSGQAVLWGGLIWLVLTGRIGFLFDSFLFLFALVTIVPVVAIIVFRWWVARQVVQGVCPSCGAEVTGLRNQDFQCMNCGNTVQGENTGNFSVKDPSSATIDIDAKEVDDF